MIRILLQVFSFLLATISCTEILQQPDNVTDGSFDNLDHNITHVCTRTCTIGAPPKVCYYKFVVESYTVLGAACKNCPIDKLDCNSEGCITADGFPRTVLSINRRIPGPSIQVCTGDTIVVDLVNLLKGRSITIHWHGIHQKKTQFMDGVPMVTQCPILEGQKFRYKFLAARPGTYYYHSHSGLQKVDGIGGSLIIRDPKPMDPHRFLYDYDLPSHVMVIQDWMHAPADDRQHILRQVGGQKPDSYLINGRGVFSTSMWDALSLKTPITEFKVRHGAYYRFRLVINTCLLCNPDISIESHPMTVISSDERDLEPLVFDKIVVTSGERYDIIIKANQAPRTYWIIVHGCTSSVFQIAALTYVPTTHGPEASPSVHPIFPLTAVNTHEVVLNSKDINCTYVEAKGRCISKMRSRYRTPSAILNVKPDLRLITTFDFYEYNVSDIYKSKKYLPYYTPSAGFYILGLINNASLLMSPSPLLTQRNDIPKHLFCTPECQENEHPCECLNVVNVPLNSVVEIVLVDKYKRSSHPFHLHGHAFYVLTQGKLGANWNATMQDLYKKLESGEFLHEKLPVKDNIAVPTAGYTVFRVLFDNPGYWLLHCHVLYHFENGMGMIIQVGDENDVGPIPQEFPKCGNFLPDI